VLINTKNLTLSCGWSKHSDCSLFWPVISRRKNQWYSFIVTFGAKSLTDMVTSVPPYETFNLIVWWSKALLRSHVQRTMLSRLKRGHSSLIVHFIVKINCTYPWETNSGLGGLTCFMQVPAHTTLLSPLWGHYGLIMYGMVRTECTVTYCFKALPRSPALEHSDLVVQVMSGMHNWTYIWYLS
jgi:hypothetical protein